MQVYICVWAFGLSMIAFVWERDSCDWTWMHACYLDVFCMATVLQMCQMCKWVYRNMFLWQFVCLDARSFSWHRRGLLMGEL